MHYLIIYLIGIFPSLFLGSAFYAYCCIKEEKEYEGDASFYDFLEYFFDCDYEQPPRSLIVLLLSALWPLSALLCLLVSIFILISYIVYKISTKLFK